MDRRTLIAFALIFVLFIAYFGYMSRFSSPAPEPGAAPDTVYTERVIPQTPPIDSRSNSLDPREVSNRAAADPGSLDTLGDPLAPERVIVIETEKARYTLSSLGATIIEVELFDFDGIDSEFAQLVGGEPALGIVFETPQGEVSSADWRFSVDLPAGENLLSVRSGEERGLVFRVVDGNGAEFIKSFTFHGDGYDVDFALQADLGGALLGTDAVDIDWRRGIRPTEKNRKDELRTFNNFYQVGESQTKKSLRNFEDGGGRATRGIWSEEGTLQWVATRSKYFVAALIPDALLNGSAALTGDKEGEYLGWRASYPLRDGRNRFAESFSLYVGPLDYAELKIHGRGLQDLVDMGKLLRPISLSLKWFMDFLSRFIPNYGVIIILMSIFTKLLFYRLTHKGFKSMKAMQAVQPELKKLQEKYKNNKEQLNKAMMELYKEHGVNPLGGCMPLLLQMPVFFALYRVLRGAVELRGAGFIGWIDDLSNMDVIYELPFAIPLLGGFIENSISILPILMGLSMWAQQKWGGSGMGMSPGSPQAGQMAAMNKVMPIFMTFIFYRMPSGLVLYWLVNNILTAVQQYYIHRGHDDTGTVVPAKA